MFPRTGRGSCSGTLFLPSPLLCHSMRRRAVLPLPPHLRAVSPLPPRLRAVSPLPPASPRRFAPAAASPRRFAPAAASPHRFAPAAASPHRFAPAAASPRRFARGAPKLFFLCVQFGNLCKNRPLALCRTSILCIDKPVLVSYNNKYIALCQ